MSRLAGIIGVLAVIFHFINLKCFHKALKAWEAKRIENGENVSQGRCWGWKKHGRREQAQAPAQPQ